MMVLMLIVADEQIWGVPDVFKRFGDVRVLSSDAIRKTVLKDAAVLIVRSVTRVDERLLGGTPVRFVGSATSGTDHVDLAWLESNGIRFADAAGCNALPVVQYVLAALLVLAERRAFELSTKTLGIVGAGRIGSGVARWARSLGMSVLLNDPPLARRGGPGYVSFSDLADRADIVTIHVPLTRAGEDQTAGMVDGAWLERLRSGVVFVNTSRGEVVDESALAGFIKSGRSGGAVLDVWRREPAIDPRLLGLVDIATPHVAGYSRDAARRASLAVNDALGQWAGVPTGRYKDECPARRDLIEVRPEPTGVFQKDICNAVATACDVASIDRALRKEVASGPPGSGFERLRKTCRAREEFDRYRVRVASSTGDAGKFLSFLGFRVSAGS